MVFDKEREILERELSLFFRSNEYSCETNRSMG